MEDLSEFEKEVAKAVANPLFEYRLLQLEEGHRKIETRMETLATKTDVQDIKKQISSSSDQRFEWWKVVGASILSAVLVFIGTLAANALGVTHH